MNASLTRETLGKLLTDENAALRDFETLLETEYGALTKRDVAKLESLAETRQDNMHRLLQVEEERRSLCGMLGYDTDLRGLGKLIAWCDPGKTLSQRYDECAQRARKCRDLNDRNGVLVGAQIKRVTRMLGALTGAGSAPRTYGPRGQSNAYTASSGTVLSAEA